MTRKSDSVLVADVNAGCRYWDGSAKRWHVLRDRSVVCFGVVGEMRRENLYGDGAVQPRVSSPDTLHPSRPRQAAIEFHKDRVLRQRLEPSVRIIITSEAGPEDATTLGGWSATLPLGKERKRWRRSQPGPKEDLYLRRGKALSDGIRAPETAGCKGQMPSLRPPVSDASLRYFL